MQVYDIGAVAGVFEYLDVAARFYPFAAFEAYVIPLVEDVFCYLNVEMAIFFPAFPASFT